MRTSLALALFVFIFLHAFSSAEPFWLRQTPDDPALSLAVLPDTTKDGRPELVAGYDSGAIACFDTGSLAKPPLLWSAAVNGSVLAVRPIADVNADGFPEVVATTDTGDVACISAGGPDAGTIRWSLNVVVNISELVVLNDMTGDGVAEVAFGGAGHRVHVVDGANGKELWSRFLEADGDLSRHRRTRCATPDQDAGDSSAPLGDFAVRRCGVRILPSAKQGEAQTSPTGCPLPCFAILPEEGFPIRVQDSPSGLLAAISEIRRASTAVPQRCCARASRLADHPHREIRQRVPCRLRLVGALGLRFLAGSQEGCPYGRRIEAKIEGRAGQMGQSPGYWRKSGTGTTKASIALRARGRGIRTRSTPRRPRRTMM